MAGVEFGQTPCPISEVVRKNLKSYVDVFQNKAKTFDFDSRPNRLFRETIDFFQRASEGGGHFEYLPKFEMHEVLEMVDILGLRPEENKDIAFMWERAIAHDQKFRWDKPWRDDLHNHKWKVEVYTSSILREIPIVLAEVKSVSKFAGLQMNLVWFVITPQMITFATGSENPDEDWYYHPERILRKNWLNYTDNEIVMKFLKDKEDEEAEEETSEGWI